MALAFSHTLALAEKRASNKLSDALERFLNIYELLVKVVTTGIDPSWGS